MAKKSHAKRQARYQGEHNTYHSKQRDSNRSKSKRRQSDNNSNIVDINSHSNQLETAYYPIIKRRHSKPKPLPSKNISTQSRTTA